MSSKKQRKRFRILRVKQLCIRAAWLHYKAEEDRLYLDALGSGEKMPYGTPIDMIRAHVEMCRMQYWGYAHARFQEWWMGFTKLRFATVAHGKIRAKDIKVQEE